MSDLHKQTKESFELRLPNALKIKSFTCLKERLVCFLKENQGKHPEHILVNRRQYHEYEELFHRNVLGSSPQILYYQGIPLKLVI